MPHLFQSPFSYWQSFAILTIAKYLRILKIIAIILMQPYILIMKCLTRRIRNNLFNTILSVRLKMVWYHAYYPEFNKIITDKHVDTYKKKRTLNFKVQHTEQKLKRWKEYIEGLFHDQRQENKPADCQNGDVGP